MALKEANWGTRKASHAGSWYTSNPDKLDQQLSTWLEAVPAPVVPARALIVPHAGYRYSGPSAAHGYRRVDVSRVKRVFLLGPSHHKYFNRCGITTYAEYETPLGNITIDKEVTAQLERTKLFETISRRTDEEEHSLEMHLPYIVKIMGGREFKLVPIMVGDTSREKEEAYGRLLAPYLDDPENLFLISSDFCHWGSRFDYMYYNEADGAIWQSIEKLDRRGMNMIESGDPHAFYQYLEETTNTICGRHPIGILMWTLKFTTVSMKVDGVHYAQSSQCVAHDDSSVSYAVLAVEPR